MKQDIAQLASEALLKELKDTQDFHAEIEDALRSQLRMLAAENAELKAKLRKAP